MKIFEFEKRDIETAYYDPADDKMTAVSPDDGKPRLTLAKLNKLKKLKQVQKLEAHKRQDLLAAMYGLPEDDGGGMGF